MAYYGINLLFGMINVSHFFRCFYTFDLCTPRTHHVIIIIMTLKKKRSKIEDGVKILSCKEVEVILPFYIYYLLPCMTLIDSH